MKIRSKPASWAMLCPACNVGQRGNCDCPMPAEACTELGAGTAPAPWHRAWPLVACIALLALYASVDELPTDGPIAAMAWLPGDGFPPELRATIPTGAASEVQP